MKQTEPNTIVLDNFSGRLTRYVNGDLNSGYAKYTTTNGANSFGNPKVLQFMEQANDIGGSVVTDLIVAGRGRVENGTNFVYSIGHTGRLYKIQVNDPASHNANYDTPVLVTTLTNSQTFTRAGSIEFYGSTEKIFIGCDQGVTKINFDGTGETVIGTTSSTQWILNAPRESNQFQGKIYYTNGANIAEIDSTELVTTYTKISPGFPSNNQSRDIDVTADGRYLVITVTRNSLSNIVSTTPITSVVSSSESYIVYWNGTDTAASSFTNIPSFEQTAYHTFSNNEYTFGYDITGSIISTPQEKLVSLIGINSPLPNSVGSNGGIMGWMVPEFVSGFYKASLFLYGYLDTEVPVGFYRQFSMASSLNGGFADVMQVPWHLLVSNFVFAGATSGYATPFLGYGKMYFSTLEFDGTNTAYKLYRFFNVPAGINSSTPGVYETQCQLFREKILTSEIRVYMEPGVSGNAFTMALTGIDGAVIANSSQTFTVGTNVDVGEVLCRYNPAHGPTPAVGIRITNAGTITPYIHKIEYDWVPAGE